jgi:hypothetical protein
MLCAVFVPAALFSAAPAVAQTAPLPTLGAPTPTPVAPTPAPVAAPAAPASPPPPPKANPPDPRLRDLLVRATRMQSTLGRLAEKNGSSGMRGFLDLALGAAYAGIGVAVALDTREKPRDSFARGLAVVESLAIGGTYLGKGIYGLSLSSSTEEHRYARFLRDVREHRMTEVRLAQYEGELYIDAVHARSSRRFEAWANLGGALAGAGLIALAATSDMTGAAKGITYLEGAVLMPTCAIASVIGFTNESTNEKEWHRYRSQRTVTPVARLTVLPVLTPSYALLVVGSSF